MKKLWLLVPLFALSGCSMFLSDKTYPLEETDAAAVKDCRKVGEFRGPEGYRFWGPPVVLSGFKTQAAEKAKAMGATHICWQEVSEGYNGVIVGYAYDCTGVDMRTDDEEDDW